MKHILFFFSLLVVSFTHAQITLESGNWTNNGVSTPFMDLSNYGSSGTFALATSAQAIMTDPKTTFASLVKAQDNLVPTGTGAYAFGIIGHQPTNINILSVSDFDISNKNGSSGTIDLVFANVQNLDFIAYTGGVLTTYSYDSTNKKLHISFSAATAAASGSNLTGGQVLLGMVLVTDQGTGFEGAVFRTDMFWGDIKMQQTDTGSFSYGDTSNFPGSNFFGKDKSSIHFDYYISQNVLVGLNQSPVTDLDKCTFTFTKADGTQIIPDKSVKYYTTDGLTTSWGGSQVNGTSNFDFNGDGTNDNYVNVSVSNDSWSSANGYISGANSTTTQNLEIRNLYIFPNPTSSILHIDQKFSMARLFDLKGQELMKFNQKNIDLSQLTKSVYILKLYNESEQVSGVYKILKK